MTFRTVDLNTPFASRDNDLLTTAGTCIYVMCPALLHNIFFPAESLPDPGRHGKILFIFAVSLLDIPGKHPEISVNDGNKANRIQKSAHRASSRKEYRDHNTRQRDYHCKPRKCVNSIPAFHKFQKFFSHLNNHSCIAAYLSVHTWKI